MKILIAGDLFISDSYKNKQLIDPSVEKLFTSADYRILNLEAPITTNEPNHKILKTGPHLRTSENATIPYLKQLKTNMVTLANNHILDYGTFGLQNTMETLERNHIAYVGAGNNLDEAARPYTLEKEGIKITFLNFAENEWASASQSSAGSHPMDIIENVHEIKNAKRNSDYVVVIVHGGHEHHHLPSPRMQKQYRFYAENGADLIVGHHTHCIGGYEIYQGVPIYYSLGNFLFTLKVKNADWYTGLILEVEWENDELKTNLYPVCQENETFNLYLPKEKENEEILNSVHTYAEIIKNESLLEQSWEQYITLKSKEYLDDWSPVSFIKNKYLRSVFNKLGIDLKNKKGLSLFLNLMRCEAHSDLSKEIINNYLNK